MSEVWPLDAKLRLERAASDAIRPFKCLLLMPFESRFNQVADVIHKTATESLKQLPDTLGILPPEITRLDWVSTSGVIQQQIWQEILTADIIFCDITGYNTNVIFECGVCAAWRDIRNVVFIKDRFFKQPSAFDLAPIRYVEYEMTSEGVLPFVQKIQSLIRDVLIAYPDGQGTAGNISVPFKLSFDSNFDDLRIYTPPFAHRRIIEETLEFGSIYNFPHSWASVGKKSFLNFSVEFTAKFSNPLNDTSYIGIGLRSQHYWAHLGHILYLTKDGRIIITQPNESPPNYYKDILLRDKTKINVNDYYRFGVKFDSKKLSIKINDFKKDFNIKDMPKVFGAGLIRFQSYLTWMRLREINVIELC